LLRRELEPLGQRIGFSLPTHAKAVNPETGLFEWDGSGCRSDCSWCGFLLRVKPDGPLSRSDLAHFLEQAGIGTRMQFGGNLLRQPVFQAVLRDQPAAIRSVVAEMSGADGLMEQALFLGTYPGLTEAMLQREVKALKSILGDLEFTQTQASRPL
jgi:CDP-6-deoxy-D-xylo-4-hexulose-3-dehydrase